jgi:acetone carboxylase gamma subunit
VAIVQVVSGVNVQADQVVQVEIVQVDLVDHVQVAIDQVDLVDHVRQVPVADSLARVRQAQHQVVRREAGQVVAQIQQAVVATQRAHLENQAADLPRVASQSAPSAKSSTT